MTMGDMLLFCTLLLTAAVSSYQDLKHREIEDRVHIIALGAGMAVLVIKGFNPLDSLLGMLTGGGVLFLIAVLTKGGMGGADIKLNSVYGMILGLKLTVLALFTAFTAGAVISLLLITFKLKSRKDEIPFTPFLSAGALVSFIFGDYLIDMYLKIMLS